MNGIEKITDRITGDAGRDIAGMLDKAREEAEAIAKKYAAEADALERDIIERGKNASRERVLRLAGVAELEARKILLGAKQDMLELAFAKAMDDLLRLPEKELVDLLARLAADAAEKESAELVFSQADGAKIGAKVVEAASALLKARGSASALSLAKGSRPIRGGFVLISGDIEVNCSFEAIMRSIRDELTKDVSDILFAE